MLFLKQDSTYKYFEIILVDPTHTLIRQDPSINWLCNPMHKHRELRGLTSIGKKYHGLWGKGHNNCKCKPSIHATWKRNNTVSLCQIVDEVSVFVLRILDDDFILLRIEWISLFFVVISVVTLRILLMNDIEFWKYILVLDKLLN